MYRDYKTADAAAAKQLRDFPAEKRFIYFNRSSKRFQLFAKRCEDSHLIFLEEVKYYA